MQQPLLSAEDGFSDDTAAVLITDVKGAGSELKPSSDGAADGSGLPVPTTILEAMSALSGMSVAAMLSLGFEFVTTIITMRFVGHFEHSRHLSGTGLGLSYVNINLALAFGVLNAMATLIPQAMGDNNMKMVGVIVQRGVVVATGLAVFAIFMLAIGPEIYKAVGQHADAVADCRVFVRWIMLGVWPLCLYFVLQQFLTGQAIFWPAVCVLAVAACFQVGMSQLLVYGVGSWGGMGWEGAPLAMALQRWFLFLSLLCVTLVRGDHKASWNGWSSRLMFNAAGLKQFVKLGVPSGVSLFAESFGFELLTIVTGWLGQDELAAMTLVSQVYLQFWFMFLGISVATSVLTGSLIGAGKAKEARVTANGAMVFTLLLSLVTAVVFFLLGHRISKLLSSNRHVQKLAADAFQVAAFVHIMDVFQCTQTGVLLGIGKPERSAILNLVSYYLIALPVACLLAWVAHAGLQGVWFGLLAGVTVVAISHFVYFNWTLDWEQRCVEAKARSDAERLRIVGAGDDGDGDAGASGAAAGGHAGAGAGAGVAGAAGAGAGAPTATPAMSVPTATNNNTAGHPGALRAAQDRGQSSSRPSPMWSPEHPRDRMASIQRSTELSPRVVFADLDRANG